MGMPKRQFQIIRKAAEKQGCEVSSHSGGATRIKTPSGPVIVVHSSPSNVETYLRDVRKKFIAAGLQPF